MWCFRKRPSQTCTARLRCSAQSLSAPNGFDDGDIFCLCSVNFALHPLNFDPDFLIRVVENLIRSLGLAIGLASLALLSAQASLSGYDAAIAAGIGGEVWEFGTETTQDSYFVAERVIASATVLMPEGW